MTDKKIEVTRKGITMDRKYLIVIILLLVSIVGFIFKDSEFVTNLLLLVLVLFQGGG